MSNASDFVIKGNTLKKYKGAGGDVIIPEGINRISDEAFGGCGSVLSVFIPDGVTILGERVFYKCANLKEVRIPDSLKSVKLACFAYCSSLKKVAFPKKMDVIESRIFVNCDSLEEIVMPETVDTINKDIIVNCGSLQKLYCSGKMFSKFEQAAKDNVAIAWLSGAANYSADQEKALQKYIARVCNRIFDLFPEHNGEAVTNLLGCVQATLDQTEDWVKKCNEGKHPNMLAVLLDYKNKNFTTEVVQTYQTDKMEKAMGLKKRPLAEWKKIFKFVADDDGIRITGYKSTEPVVEIPEEIDGTPVTCIGDKAFRRIDFIAAVLIPESVAKIGKTAFGECAGLVEIRIPESVVEIGNCAFSGCTAMETITLPEKLKSIGYELFAGCSNLKSIEIPQSVEEIGGYAFLMCEELKSITIPDSVKKIIDNCYSEPSYDDNVFGRSFGENSFYSSQSSFSGGYSGNRNEPMFEKSAVVTEKPKATSSSLDYKVGDVVHHRVFGDGLVISMTPMANDTLVEVSFEAGTKKIMANFAKLTKK